MKLSLNIIILMIIKDALIITAISASLAILISIIDAIVNNYGEVKIKINKDQKVLNVKGGSSLLLTLAENGIFIPSACGGRGTCGACKVKVVTDIGQILPTEKPLLTHDEQNQNIRLSCQVKVKQDLDLEIPEELFNVKQFVSEIISIKNVTHDIKEIKFKLLKPGEIKYKAGQYIQFEAPAYDKIKTTTQRAYSMSSKPSLINQVELLIRLVPGGIVTTYVFNYLKPGDKVNLIGPFGDFYVKDTNADMICVAGGSGMAPIKSIVHDMLENSKTDRHAWYFFGARSLKDLFYIEDFKEIEKEWPNFHFIPALSEPEPGDNWQGETGLITNVLDNYLKNIIRQDKEKEGYLCGSPGMINACVNVMTQNNIQIEKIYYDKFA